MLVIDYIRRKNEIIKSYTGITLVPEGQLIDIPVPQVGVLSMEDDELACPYCIVFDLKTCEGCPMFVAGNGCTTGDHSTYHKAIDKFDYVEGLTEFDAPWYDELSELINQYNNELKG